ncbi:MAG TPA: hypothetical protein VH621_04285 [Nitrososphaera sp.]
MTMTQPLTFKEIYCSDCKTVLARYSTKYFSDGDINELMRLHYSSHIKDGHSMGTRISE